MNLKYFQEEPREKFRPYTIENSLQEKRFRAQTNHTTYVYDLPDMFRKMTERLWDKCRVENVERPSDVMARCVELVWTNDRLEEMEREAGANDVSWLVQEYGFVFLIIRLDSVEWLPGEWFCEHQSIRRGGN